MSRIILAFNADFESRLALHWLVHEKGHEVITISLNLGQEVPMTEMGQLALELGASGAHVVDRRDLFLEEFALPVLQAGAVYQSSCFLGSALARYLIAQELVNLADEENCDIVAHGCSTKGNDQVRMETAIAGQNPRLKVVAPVREWNLKTPKDKLRYAEKRNITIEAAPGGPVAVDRNLWGVSLYVSDLTDAWQEPPESAYVLTRSLADSPNEPELLSIGFEAGVPVSINGKTMSLAALVKELNRIGGLHGVGRTDVVEDRLFGIKSREFYEAPTPTILLTAMKELQNLVHSREMLQLREIMSRRYAELAYTGLWFHELREALQGFFSQTQRKVNGEVRMRLFKGNCAVLGRRSPNSLYDSRLANQSNQEFFDAQWAQGFSSIWSLPVRRMAEVREAEE